MKTLHCPTCGTPFVRVTYEEGTVERVLNRMKVFPFRCQLCTTRFRAFWTGSPNATQAFDRRQYKRLRASFHANLLADNAPQMDNRVTDISMGGCTLETAALLPRGTFLELAIKPASDEEAIKVDTAMVCSVRPESMGVRFLEFQASDKRRLSQVVLSLLVGQSVHPNLYS
jgi:c-di-GMP-binding flagellar brake protein YcgR